MKRLIRGYFWVNGKQSILELCFDEDRETFVVCDSDGQQVDGNQKEWPDLYRVVYLDFSENAHAYHDLVLDVGPGSKVEVDNTPDGNPKLTVTGKIICILNWKSERLEHTCEYTYKRVPGSEGQLSLSKFSFVSGAKEGSGSSVAELLRKWSQDCEKNECSVCRTVNRQNDFYPLLKHLIEYELKCGDGSGAHGKWTFPVVDGQATEGQCIERRSDSDQNSDAKPKRITHIIEFKLDVKKQQWANGKLTTFWDKECEPKRDLSSDDVKKIAAWIQRPVIEPTPSEPPRSRPRAKWYLQAQGLSTNAAAKCWNWMADDYHVALERVQGGRPVSFLPELDVKGNTDGNWAMTYLVEDGYGGTNGLQEYVVFTKEPDKESDKVVVSPLSLVPMGGSGGTLELKATLPRVITHDGADTKNVLLAASLQEPKSSNSSFVSAAEKHRGISIELTKAVAVKASEQKKVRIGSLDLTFGTQQHTVGKSWIMIWPEGSRKVGVKLEDVSFDVAGVLPGGQDAPEGEEYAPERLAVVGMTDQQAEKEGEIEARFRPKTPVVIPLPNSHKPDSSYLLRVREDVTPEYDQTLRLDLTTTDSALNQEPRIRAADARPTDLCTGPEEDSVLVLDAEPFLVAQVRYIPFQSAPKFGSNVIAQWSNADPEGAGWKLLFEEQPFCLKLPPQAIGEEMLKRVEIEPDKPIRYELGPTTDLILDPRIARTRFAEAPWNLRRILGTPGRPWAGPLVRYLQYELLYGLSCRADEPAVRLAEIFSRVGRIPGRMQKNIAWEATNEQERQYEGRRDEWSRIYAAYLARVAVLQPWDTIFPTDPSRTVTLKDGLVCRFRLPPCSELANPFDQDDKGLRGGATWGFESKNVYDASVSKFDNPPEVRDSSSAELADIALSALGGWGHQMAGFNNDLTKIYADVAMGRVYRYKLERYGRIGVFWNLAKHVIVYERTVIGSRQFREDQGGAKYDGWPLIRKVREYVEILEDTRSYPDQTSGTPTLEERRRRGFVANCSFQKGDQISVHGSWGQDISFKHDPADSGLSLGWKIPLWVAGANPPDVYPKPKVHLGVISVLRGLPAVLPCPIAEPQNLTFFTLTHVWNSRRGLHEAPDRDPNIWKPIPGVDYVNLPTPAAASGKDFKEGDHRQYTPDEPDVPPGYSTCTFRLEPEVTVDLVAERAEKALSALVDTVTMARSAPASGDGASEPLEDIAEEIGITDCFKELLRLLPGEGEDAGLGAIERLKNLKTNPRELLGKYDRLYCEFRSKHAELRRQATDLEDQLCRRFNDAIEEAVRPVLETISGWKDQVRNWDDQKKAKDQLQALLADCRRDVEAKLLLIHSFPGLLSDMVSRHVSTVLAHPKVVDEALSRLEAQLKEGISDVDAALSTAETMLRRGEELMRALEPGGIRMPVPWLPDPAPIAQKLKAFYFGTGEKGFAARAEDLVKTLRGRDLKTARTLVNSFRNEYYQKRLDDLSELARHVETFIGVSVPAAKIDEIREKAEYAANVLLRWLEAWKCRVDEVDALITGTRDDLVQMAEAIEDWLGTGFLKREIDAVCAELRRRSEIVLDALFKEASAPLKQFEDLVEQAVAAIEQATEGKETEVRRALEKARDDLMREAARLADKVLPAQIALDPGRYQNAAGALRLIRAFGAPPRVPRLDFGRQKLGYYFRADYPHVDLTPVLTMLNPGVGALALEKLKPLGIRLPSVRLLDQVIPADLAGFDVSKLFPNFAGLDLTNLFRGLKAPAGLGSDNIKITHGIDEQTRRASVRVDVNFDVKETATVFTFGPVSLQVVGANFRATQRIETGLDGRVETKMNGQIEANWQLVIGEIVLLKLNRTVLHYDDSGELQFNLDPRNIEFPGALVFLSRLIKASGGGSGFTPRILEDGVEAVLALPLPDTQAGVTGISNLRISLVFSLRFPKDFRIGIDFRFGERTAPFTLTILVLGGAGYMSVEAGYVPKTGELSCNVALDIAASASLAIALGPINGGVYAYLGIMGRYQTSGGGITIGQFLLIRGQVSVLGIVSVCVTLRLELFFQDNKLLARGRLSISIEISWFYTLEVHEEVQWKLGDVPVASMQPSFGPVLIAGREIPEFALQGGPWCRDDYERFAGWYVDLFED